MTDEMKKPTAPNPSADDKAASAPKITRRRFTKAGAIAPVVMTLGARPVWGQTCSFSGQLSGNDYMASAPSGGGDPPSDWYKSDNPLVVVGEIEIEDGDVVAEVVSRFLPTTPCTYFDTGSSATFKKYLKEGNNDLDAQAAAAVLNSLKGGYGYGLDGVMTFLCTTAVAHETEALALLKILNSQNRVCI